jgi:hypothetical protein
LARLNVILAVGWMVAMAQPAEAMPSARRTERVKKMLRRGLLGNRRLLQRGMGGNVSHFETHPQKLRAVLAPELARVTNGFDRSIEPQIRALERAILKAIRERTLHFVPTLAIRGVTLDTKVSRDSALAQLRQNGFVSAKGGNYFIFSAGQGSFAPGELEAREPVATFFWRGCSPRQGRFATMENPRERSS